VSPAPAAGGVALPDRDDTLARAIVDTLPPGLADVDRRRALRTVLDAYDRAHAACGVPSPPWIARARSLHLADA
jgi:hypothetical protein